ncbi:hypothetical protein ACFC3P_12385 [Enterococcus thailandicus]|uniref:hypothetical protein n=1 Tax=Enterococcus thailandicus TaxID=417368 RepID=UPI0039A463C6
MRKVYPLILKAGYVVTYILIIGASIGCLLFLFNLKEKDVFDKILEIVVGVTILLLLILLKVFLQKENREEFNQEVEMQANDWIEFNWTPFKKNIKRKEFWQLQLWTLGKICIFVARLIFDLIVYLTVVFGTAYLLLNNPSKITASNIFTVLTTLILAIFLSTFANVAAQIIKKKLTVESLLKNLYDLFIISVILETVIKQIEQSGRTANGVKEFLMTIDHFVNGNMYLFKAGVVLALVGYVSTKLIKRSIEKEMIVDLIPTIFGYEYYANYGKYDELIHTNFVRMSVQEYTLKGIREGQETKEVVRRKEVYNFYEVEASLRYGIGKLGLNGTGIQQNKAHFTGKKGELELHMEDK